MQFVARNAVKVELDSTSATLARNVERRVASCVRALSKSICTSMKLISSSAKMAFVCDLPLSHFRRVIMTV